MPRLVWLAVAAISMNAVADLAAATTYVPGQIRDGVYIRPHFVGAGDPLPDAHFVIPIEETATEAELGSEAAVLGPPVAPPPTGTDS